ncbi:MAG: hydrogenase maturation nickel metallochaperone HypA [Proteobacteria bacterium]|nr:hydrogenase maturation nickel metallochaperone HypA [Pseudomonadota bacterium]
MHELQVTERILDIVLAHAQRNNVQKVVSISLRVGEMSDLEDEWIQHYFDYLAKESLAEGAKLKIERVPVQMRCDECMHSFQIDIKAIKEIECPECGSKKSTLTAGKDYYIKDMEVI